MTLPAYAASIWTVGDNLHLGYPSSPSHERVHDTKLSFNLAALRNMLTDNKRRNMLTDNKRLDLDERKTLRSLHILLLILKEREASPESQAIGHSGSPTQDSIEKMMKSFDGQIKYVGRKRVVKDITLEELGL